MADYKNAIFLYETDLLPPELKVISEIANRFKALPALAATLVQTCHTMQEATKTIDDFKSRSCGSPYTLAVINLNMFPGAKELDLLLQSNMLGDPRAIFLVSLRFMVGEAYLMAKAKLRRETDSKLKSPSCINCYAAPNREELIARVSQLGEAYLQEAEEQGRAKQSGESGSQARVAQLMKKSETVFYIRKRSGKQL